jgi:hypothetical protein
MGREAATRMGSGSTSPMSVVMVARNMRVTDNDKLAVP